MREFFKALDAWLFSPPHPFESVLKTTDILLQASDPIYARYGRHAAPLFQPPVAKPIPEAPPVQASEHLPGTQ